MGGGRSLNDVRLPGARALPLRATLAADEAEGRQPLLEAARADCSTEKAFRRLLAPDLLLVDDFGLRNLNAEQSSDFYELVLERHRRSSTIVTSNRDTTERIPLFDDLILAQSALDRLAHGAHPIVLDSPSYRERQRPGTEPRGASTPPAAVGARNGGVARP